MQWLERGENKTADATPSLLPNDTAAILAQLYANRGLLDATELTLPLHALPDPWSMLGMKTATTRIQQAIAQQEKILIIADYDADGATACAVLLRGLRHMGATVDFLVPNRFTYGYGLTPELVELAITYQPRILLTVDNGIASVAGAAAAAQHGLDLIITDHHLPGPELPEALAILNPNQPGCPFPSKNLAGVGVAFYLLMALRAALRQDGCFKDRTEPNLAELLPLVALGTVADLVPLDRLNRTLVQQGLQRIRQQQGPAGLFALYQTAKRDAEQTTTTDLAFAIGPRLNAAGRMADMRLGILCLTTDHATEAIQLAQELDTINQERRSLETQMQETALAQALTLLATLLPDPANPLMLPTHTLSLFHSDWHPGIIGIVAGRLKDRFHRPTFVFAPDQPGTYKGSGRSIPGFHLRDALDLVAKRAPHCLLRFGGHAMAAGLTIPADGFTDFQEIFEAVAAEQLTPQQLQRTITHDGILPNQAITLDLIQQLEQTVWGQGFPAPQFLGSFKVLEQRIVGEKHRKLRLQHQNVTFDGILFNHPDQLPTNISTIYQIQRSTWNGQSKVNLLIEHWREC